MNEFPFQHLLSKLEGKTIGLSTFAGTIRFRIRLMKWENVCVALFEPMSVSWLSEMQKTEDLSTDQKYSFYICKAISTGQCSQEFKNRKLWSIVQMWWIMPACRILHFSFSSSKPDEPPKYRMQYVNKFMGKCGLMSGKVQVPLIICMIYLDICDILSKVQPLDKLKNIVYSVVQINRYYGYPNN